MVRRGVVSLLLSWCLATPVMALSQDPAGRRVRLTLVSWPAERLGDRFPDGDRYRTFEGTMVAVRPESLTVAPAAPRPGEDARWTIGRTNLYRVQHASHEAHSTTKGLVAGAIAGAILGAAIGAVTHPEAEFGDALCGGSSPVRSSLRCGAILAAMGGATGALVGATRTHTVWVDVPLTTFFPP